MFLAFEERKPELHFRMLQGRGDSGLRHVKQACGPTDTASDHDSMKGLYVLKFH
jgi:hypothetical protein